MQKFFIILGLIFVILGVVWPLLSKLSLGRLPGDIYIERENFSFYFPLTTGLLLSAILSLLLWWMRK